VILYEYPCNERVRIFLRVEHLFKRLSYFIEGDDPHLHQVAVTTLFDLLELTDRVDLRGMVLQDIERQRNAMQALREHPGVSEQAVDRMFAKLQEVADPLAAQGRIAQDLRENEWLQSLRGRLTVPGCLAQIDAPSFYCWQKKPADQRQADIRLWADSLMPLAKAIALLLQLLRDAADVVERTAVEGGYQEMLGGKSFQLLRVWVPAHYQAFPEMSANKYVIWVRFAQQKQQGKPTFLKQDIPFKLACCTIG